MREFSDDNGEVWVANAREEDTPRHHGRWYLVFHSARAGETLLPMPEVRWQTRPTAERTLQTMSEFELRRRLKTVVTRAGHAPPPGGGRPEAERAPRETVAGPAAAPADAVSGSESSDRGSAGED